MVYSTHFWNAYFIIYFFTIYIYVIKFHIFYFSNMGFSKNKTIIFTWNLWYYLVYLKWFALDQMFFR